VPLSLKKAVEIALAPEGSARIALAQEATKQAEQRVKQAHSAFLPTIDGAISERDQTTNLKSFGLNFQLPFAGFSFPSLAGPFAVFDARFSAQQSVLDFTILRRYQASKASLEAVKLEIGAAQTAIADQVAKAYAAALRADAALEAVRANVQLSEALVKLADQQKTAGSGTGIEVTRAQVQLANDRQRLIKAENDRRSTVLQLMRIIGLGMESEVQLTDKLKFEPLEINSLTAAVDSAKKMRADLKVQQQKEEASRVGVSAVKAERLPSVAAFGDYGSNGPAINESRATRSVGVAVKIPLFDGGRRDSRKEEASSQFRQEQIRTRDLQRQVELDVRLAWDSVRSTQAQVDTAREGLALAENELAQARRRYEAGVTNSIEVTDAQTRLDRARDNQVAALYSYNVARIDLSTAMGTIGEYVNQ